MAMGSHSGDGPLPVEVFYLVIEMMKVGLGHSQEAWGHYLNKWWTALVRFHGYDPRSARGLTSATACGQSCPGGAREPCPPSAPVVTAAASPLTTTWTHQTGET